MTTASRRHRPPSPFRIRARAVAFAWVAALLASSRAAVAANATGYEHCSLAKFSVDYWKGGAWASLPVPYVGRTGLRPNGAGGVAWSCGTGTGSTSCDRPVAAEEVVRAGEERFRIDCYDRTGLEALEAPRPLNIFATSASGLDPGNATKFERCREERFDVHYVDGTASLVKPVAFSGRTGLLAPEPSQRAGGEQLVRWDCNGPSHDVTRCPLGTAAFEVVRTGQAQFRIDCYDKTALSARPAGV